MPVFADIVFDFNAIRIVRTNFVQRYQVSGNQTQQNQWNRNYVEREEAVQRCIRHHIVTTNPQRQIRTNKRDRTKQVNNHLCPPVRHLAPRQQVTEKRLRHQAQENRKTKQPDQFPWFAIGAVHQCTSHVQVNNDEECRSTGRMHIAH